MEKLVSVIMPAYNCEKFIAESIESVLCQSYHNLELIIADDCSDDGTVKIGQKYADRDSRIRILISDKNQGAATARNRAIENAKGTYLAFLDSDDLWDKNKLERQISFMEQNNYSFTCTAYGKVNEKSDILKYSVNCEPKYDYNQILKKCPGNSTIIYDCEKLGKIYGIDIRKRNDFAMWLRVIKISGYAYGLQERLGYHRVREDGISYNKMSLIKYQWKVYRDIEKLSLVKSVYLMNYKIFQQLIMYKAKLGE